MGLALYLSVSLFTVGAALGYVLAVQVQWINLPSFYMGYVDVPSAVSQLMIGAYLKSAILCGLLLLGGLTLAKIRKRAASGGRAWKPSESGDAAGLVGTFVVTFVVPLILTSTTYSTAIVRDSEAPYAPRENIELDKHIVSELESAKMVARAGCGRSLAESVRKGATINEVAERIADSRSCRKQHADRLVDARAAALRFTP